MIAQGDPMPDDAATGDPTTSKYALVERERRWLVPTMPDEEPTVVRRIEDLYIAGTRMRLRRWVPAECGTAEGGPAGTALKLTQKVPSGDRSSGRQGNITNTYLSESEFAVFDSLPGNRIAKTRLTFPPLVIDVFEGALEGLMIAEMEFGSDEAMDAFEPPSWCGAEITADPAYRGSSLAERATRGP